MDRRLFVLIACFLTIFTSYAVRYGYGILLPEMLPTLSISKAEAGVIYSSFFIAYTIMSPVLGLLGDRYNIRFLLTFFVAIFAAGTFLMAFSSSIVHSSLFFALAGVGSAVCWAPTVALAQRWTSDKHRGKTLAFIDIGSALGIIGTSTAIPIIVTANDWRFGWMSLGILGFIVTITNYIAIREKKDLAPSPQDSTIDNTENIHLKGIYLQLLKDKKFWLIGMAYLLTGFSIIVPFTFLSTYAFQELSMSYETSTRLITVIGIGAIIGKTTLGPLSDIIGRIRVMMLSAFVITVGCLGMAFAKGFGLVLFISIFSLGYGIAWSMYAASASDYFSKKYSGSIVGLWTVYLGIGSVISPIIAGSLADITGSLSWSFVMSAVGGGISFLMLVPLWRLSPIDSFKK